MGYTLFEEAAAVNGKRPAVDTPPPSKRQKIESEDNLIAPALQIGAQQQQKKQKKEREAKEKAAQLLNARKQLPVWNGRQTILDKVRENDTVIIMGETGSGKTTQIPQFLMDSNIPCQWPKICVTQPRRVAATSLAARVAEEVGCKLGNAVGYTVRFDDKSKAGVTRLKFVTDGTLLQEILADPLLGAYDVVFVDEAHERTLRTDMVLGFLKSIQAKRKMLHTSTSKRADGSIYSQLKIIVMSATLNAESFARFFDNAPILYVKGRLHKVTIQYTAANLEDYIEGVLKTCLQIHVQKPPGDILVFLTGEEEIENMATALQSYASFLPEKCDKMQIVPFYARLPPAQQAQAFTRTPLRSRKIVLATNVAETSITIPGIKYVVDAGLMKEKRFHGRSNFDTLQSRPISRSNAQQRAGRAGRESAGECYRLYTEQSFTALDEFPLPEIKRCNLAFAILHLMAAGEKDPFSFAYIDQPEQGALIQACMQLVQLEALGKDRQLTKMGQDMASFPLEPHYARILLASFKNGCPLEMLSIVSLMSFSDSILITPSSAREKAAEAHSKFVHRDGDHLTLLNTLRAYEEAHEDAKGDRSAMQGWCRDNFVNYRTIKNVLEARSQLVSRCERRKYAWNQSCGNDEMPILESLLVGLGCNVAMRTESGAYKVAIGKQEIKIHPSSVLHQKRPKCIFYSELTMTTQVYARTVSIAPSHFVSQIPTMFAWQMTSA